MTGRDNSKGCEILCRFYSGQGARDPRAGFTQAPMSIQSLCKLCSSVHASDRRATVFNLDTFLKGQVGGAEFFEENHFTHGMLTPFVCC